MGISDAIFLLGYWDCIVAEGLAVGIGVGFDFDLNSHVGSADRGKPPSFER